jgi:hypothetical protein
LSSFTQARLVCKKRPAGFNKKIYTSSLVREKVSVSFRLLFYVSEKVTWVYSRFSLAFSPGG